MRAPRALLPALLLLLGLAAPAQAATFNVNTLGDGIDQTPGDGVCSTVGGVCTVRAAVQEADSATPADEIVLGPGVHSLTGGSLSVSNNDVTIRGAGASTTRIDQTTAGQRLLFVSSSTATIRDLALTGANLALTGGSGLAVGGGLLVDVGPSQSVALDRVLIADNHVSASGGSGSSAGGGIYKFGAGLLTLTSSTVRANTATTTAGTPSDSAVGGGIYHGDGPMNLTNVTIEGNRAEGVGGAGSYGGGLDSGGGGATALSHVTLAGNAALGPDSHGGNLASNFSGHLNVDNSIIANGMASSSGGGCDVRFSGTLTSSGRNIESGSSCGFGPPHLSNTDPLLGALADNGGPTLTLLPAAGSPAIDAAIGCPTPAFDQRGVARPAGAACDIGAVERVPDSPPGGEPPAPDLAAPIVSDFRISAPRFRTSRATRRTRSLPRSTRLVFHLSEPSFVDFRFERRAAGRRGRTGSCQSPSRANRGRRACVRWLAAGSLTDNLPEGSQSLRFNGNVTRRGRGRTLGPGSYRVHIEATDTAGNRSGPAGARFRVAG